MRPGIFGLILVFLAAAAAGPALAPAARAEESSVTLDRILVVVNDEIITEQDLRAAAEPLIAQYRATLTGAALEEKVIEIRQKVLDGLIDDRLVSSQAKKEKIQVDEKEVDEMMADVRKKFPSQEVFETVLRQQGVSVAKLRERFRDQILGRRTIDLKVRSEITISPGEVRDYYDTHPDEFRAPEKARVRQILVRVGEGHRPSEEAEALVRSILDEVQKGRSMEDLARRYSEAAEGPDGGDLGWVEKGQFVEHIDQEIFGLQINQVTAPIQTQLGYHLFRLEARKPPEIRSFDQVRPRIESVLYRKKTAERLTLWLKELRTNAYIARKI